MDILFRAPLFDFEPSSEQEIEENWDKIVEAISVSSESLFEEVSAFQYRDLRPYVKKKVYKYILRGRYRATPFGKFAAVGIGGIDGHQKTQLDLDKVNSLENVAAKETNSDLKSLSYFLINDSFESWGYLRFLSYLCEDRRWGLVEIPKNETVEILIQNLKKSNSVTFETFSSWFEDPRDEMAEEIWAKMLELGILNCEQKIESSIRSSQKIKIDQVFEDRLTLPKEVFTIIKQFEDTAGQLFSQTKSSYFDSLRGWFSDKFDDRFVPLSLLAVDHEFLTGNFLKSKNFEKEIDSMIEFPPNFWTSESIDLRYFFDSQPISKGIFDLQLVFKSVGNESIQLENIVCNRPFVYFGRFNRDGNIYKKEVEIKNRIFQNGEVIYAELRLFETESVDSICLTKQLFTQYITPLSDNCPDAIQLKDIEMGLVGDRFVLVHRTLLKTIIPVVTHPLNGREISHPIMRLLWELDHQTQFRFFPFTLSRRIDISYIPRLSWGNIILQNRRWIARSSAISNEMELRKWLEKSEVPSPIVAGYMDRELLLDWKKEMELNILWSELNKWGKVNLMEPTWLGKSEFVSTCGKPIYPQFIAQKSKPKFEPNFHGLINSIEHCDRDCLYILIRVNEENLLDFLTFWFDETILVFLNAEKIKWYYLVYPSQSQYQIRIRFLTLTEIQQKMLLNISISKSRSDFHPFEIRPYYPETKKYGRSDYRKSELLFHLESSFLMKRPGDGDLKIIEFNPTANAVLLTELWESMLSAHPILIPVYQCSKEKVNALSKQELKNITGIWQELINSETLVEYQKKWIKVYSKLFLGHSVLKAGGELGLRLINNHIHMQANRFFLNDRKLYEDMIHFHLYKRLGKVIYSPKEKG
ncbi:lantibiotic dehydratase [Algoriphagus sp. A40]|uniref:lantibiotic dehydratase n=1 Tax=Algoriphagus sp. A40 TaxID=1945863 RepID=UPI0009867C12|nr:lantibiotic dehydratase [Algoriphagus sp. A40]OOG69932.1 hypothetical protein B0E43_19675 [Algoriphagus sp. A40]